MSTSLSIVTTGDPSPFGAITARSKETPCACVDSSPKHGADLASHPDTRQCSSNRDRGRLRSPTPPTPPYYGSVYGGSVILALAGWSFETLSANVSFTAYTVPFGLHPIRTGQAQPKLIGWCMTTHEVRVLLPRLLFGPSPPQRLLCPLLTSATRSPRIPPSQSLSDKQQISRGKPNRFQRTTAGFTHRCP